MKSYWDLSRKERAALTAEQLERWCDVALMQAGVEKPCQPDQHAVPEVPLDLTDVYVVSMSSRYGGGYRDVVIGFPTAELARQFMGMGALKLDTDYEVGSEINFATPVAETGEITVRRLATAVSVADKREQLRRVKQLREVNEKAMREYRTNTEKAAEVTKAILADWNDLQSAKYIHGRVRRSRAEYLAMADGNAEVAEAFLRKTYGDDVVAEADEWGEESQAEYLTATIDELSDPRD